MSKLAPKKLLFRLFSRKFAAKLTAVVALSLIATLTGCSYSKTKDGLLVRSNWTLECNRPSKCDCKDDSSSCDDPGCGRKKLFNCLAKDRDGKQTIRRHCAAHPGCSSKTPCYRTLGCGMLVESGDQTIINVAQGEGLRVCGMTPFCFPQKPCGLFPNCGKPLDANNMVNSNMANNNMGMVNLNAQTLAMSNPHSFHQLGNQLGGMPTAIRTMNPAGTPVAGSPMMAGTMPNQQMPNQQAGAVPGTLVSRGIVPGASAIVSGGMVTAIGVTTPAGTMTPVGVRLPNGMVNNAVVLRACTMSPHCTAARPCCTMPHCGGAVAINQVAGNAVALASALQAQGVASGVMQAHGGGMMMGSPMNPMTQQRVQQQPGQMPMGQQSMSPAQMEELAYALGLIEIEEEIEVQEERRAGRPEMRSQMSVPRFHPIPSKPVFQRSEGLPSTPPSQRSLSRNEPSSEEDFESKLDKAYLQGVSAAMDEVERKMETKRQAAALAQLQEKILQQAENLQQQLDEQEQMQMLALQQIQHEQQLRQQNEHRQQQLQQQQRAIAAAEAATREQSTREQAVRATAVAQQPQRPATARQATVVPHPQQSQPPQLDPLQLAGNLKTSVANSVNEVFGPLLSAVPRESAPGKAVPQTPQPLPPQPQRMQSVQSSLTAPLAALAKSEFVSELTSTTPRSAPIPELPGRPPVSPIPQEYGLQPDDEGGSYILQAEFSTEM